MKKDMFQSRKKSHHSGRLSPAENSSFKELETYLQTEPKNKDCVIYFHIPFCDHICSFCSMNRTKLKGELDDYTNFLIKEIKKFSKYPYIEQKSIKSIYFGGGTPTVLHEEHLERILKAINKNFNISDDVEYSCESTLHNLSLRKVELMQELGINRYSIGVQTFSSRGRKFLNRVGGQKFAIDTLGKIRNIFDGHLCVDIIYNYPDQTIKEVLEDAKLVEKLSIDSASFYSLMYFNNSKLGEQTDERKYNLEHDRALHNSFLDNLIKTGNYEILEHTKIVKKNRDRYRYITLRHQGVDTLPIGVGAGGRLGPYSLFAPKQGIYGVSKNSKADLKYNIFCSIFQYDKIKLKSLKKYLSAITLDKVLKFYIKLEKQGYVEFKDDEIRYTLDGIFWGNTISFHVTEIAKKDFKYINY